MKNAAVADIYDPGSVFKIVPAAGALEERLVTPLTVLDCTVDRIAHRGRMLSLPAEDHKMGNLTIGEILSHSSNRGAAQLGMMLGEERLERYARAFGFGSGSGASAPSGANASSAFICPCENVPFSESPSSRSRSVASPGTGRRAVYAPSSARET